MTLEIQEAMEWGALWITAHELGARLDQRNWLAFKAEWHLSSHLLVAVEDETVVGFLRFVLQPIGPDMDCPAVVVDGVELIESKIMAFGVVPERRRQGIGRALQQAAIERARELDCYQVRSHSSGDNQANHRLKLAMGFAMHPIVRGDDNHGCYFLMPLRTSVG
jgi:GNAT superfamily N-acetyltransferase